MTDLSLSVDRIIKAPRKAVFEAWLSPEMLKKFMLPGPDMSVPSANTDPREGGRFEIIMKPESGEIPHAGTYREISPHDRIVFTWESPYSVDDSTVTLDFADADGGTHLKLTHVRFLSEETRDNHEAGWGRILVALVDTLAEENA
ncbi:SRPBCC domain-containing protein [Aliiroseovarius sp. KMU-50]|uniref:SRPBCC domain-containing protein n=1 Tax=Aliiroseovarius salicola TaxID=3009082 RepID=A0ABT4VWJ8_9RHOB|nr:SRPBCC domain-containing protein [Aliiroseovarius sp. KMU-50]MDA5092622.1 SRPBCC domain-containing protein [Aliiroseovarius sp. KMU-50]